MEFSFDEIVEATGAELIKGVGTVGSFSVSTDSRVVGEKNVYLPLIGEKFDGHDFIEDCLEKGCRGYFTSDKNRVFEKADFILFVENTLEAYLKLALFYKKKVNPVTIAITGSSGKTTTKEMMSCVASTKYRTHKSILNHNNEVGLCQTLLSMPEDTEVLIVEMGMRGLGEIELLSKYSCPDIAIIANTGTAHIGRLGSEKNIAKAKCEISSYLHEEGLLIAHDTQLIRKVNSYKGETIYVGLDSANLTNIELGQHSSEFVFENHKFVLNVEGKHNIQNALFVIIAGLKLGISKDKIAEGLQNFRPIEKRWEIKEVNGYNIINDSYNSNPESLKAAVSTFLSTQSAPRLLVLGDMLELGKDEKKYHKSIGEFLNTFDDVELITVGNLGKYIAKTFEGVSHSFKTNDEAVEYIRTKVSKGTNMLFKASRSMKFEEIIKELEK